MKFLIPINVPEENGSQTVDVVDTGSSCARTNKAKLREYFIWRGVPKYRVKHVMKKMGFWGDTLHGNDETSNT